MEEEKGSSSSSGSMLSCHTHVSSGSGDDNARKEAAPSGALLSLRSLHQCQSCPGRPWNAPDNILKLRQ